MSQQVQVPTERITKHVKEVETAGSSSLGSGSSSSAGLLCEDSLKSLSVSGESEVSIRWEATLPIPSDEQEELLLRSVLLPGIDLSRIKNKSVLRGLMRAPLLWTNLSAERQAAITRACSKIGVHVKQAMGLRKTAYQGAHFLCAQMFQGGEAAALAKAEQLEADVAALLAFHGVRFQTQAELVAEYKALDNSGDGRPTPDFLILSPLLINGLRVRWIEVKNFYGAGIERGVLKWMPTIKIQAQIAKYIQEFGPDGAVILNYGYAQSFRNRTPLNVQLLDWGKSDLI